MKKFLITVIILAAIAGGAYYAYKQGMIPVPATLAAEQVVPIEVKNADGVGALHIEVTYDAGAFEATGVKRGKLAKGGAVEFRVEKAGVIHAGVGKASFTEQALVDNIRAFAEAVIKAKPSGAKGTFVKKIAVTSTMGPGVKIEPASIGGA